MWRKRRTPAKIKPAPNFKPNSIMLSEEVPLLVQLRNGTVCYKFPSDIVQSFRYMITQLTRNRELPSRISVVAALREEGVTYTTMALASIIAHDLSRRTCVVDLNWWCPDERLQLLYAQDQGIVSVLDKNLALDKAFIQTANPNLTLLPAGAAPTARRPVIARGEPLKKLITHLSERFDHVLLDIPAISMTSDAITLASLGTDCCVVVGQGLSSTTAVEQALDEVNHLPMLGVVMNRVQLATPPWLLKWIPKE